MGAVLCTIDPSRRNPFIQACPSNTSNTSIGWEFTFTTGSMGERERSAPEYLILALRGGGCSTHFPSINTCPFVSAHPFFVDTALCSVAHGVQRRTALTVPPSSEVRAKHNYVCRPCQTHYTLVELSYLLPACRLRVIYYPLHTPLHTDTRTHITTHAPSISNWAEDIYVPLYTYIQKSFQK